MTVATAAGVTIGVSSIPPATFDQAGWAAITFTTIGEVVDIGEFGREFAKAEHKPLASRPTQKKKASFDSGAITLGLGLDNKDAGQSVLRAAVTSDAEYYFCITLPSGDRYFFPALVFAFRPSIGSTDNLAAANVNIEITSPGVLEDLSAGGPVPPPGYILLSDSDGTLLTDTDGVYLMELE